MCTNDEHNWTFRTFKYDDIRSLSQELKKIEHCTHHHIYGSPQNIDQSLNRIIDYFS